MGVSVTLSAAALDVVPGEEAVCTATVRNTGSVIDQVNFDVVGPAAAWSVVEPPVLNLYPGDSGEVRVHFRPPRAADPAAGPTPFGVRASSLEDPRGSATEEGVVNVAPFTDLRITLVPQISRGARRGKHKVDVANLGNVAVGTEISAADPDDALTFQIRRPALVAPPGVVTQTTLTAVPRDKFWTGTQQQKPFQVVVQPERGSASTMDGTFEQDPLVPRWAVVSAAAVLALVLLLGGLWFGLVRPGIKSAATEAARVEASKAAAQVKEEVANQQGQEGDGGANGGGEETTPSPSPTPTGPPGSPGNPLTRSFDFRIATNVAPGNQYKAFESSKRGNKPLDISALLLQNFNQDSGLIEIRRGTEVVYKANLDNFRDLNEPFPTPIRFGKNDRVVVAVQCGNPPPERRSCSPAVTFVGKTA